MKFSTPLTKKEQILGMVFLVVQMVFLPSAILLLSDSLPVPLSAGVQNLLFFLINFLCVLLIFHRFLRLEWMTAKGSIPRVLRYALWGFILYYGSNLLISALIAHFFPTFANVNDSSIAAVTEQSPALMAVCTVFLAPVVEETLYRGLFFGGFYRVSPLAGYLISTVLFGLIHILGYLWYYDALTLFLCFCQYIPAGIFLGWAYVKSGTIWCPILIHMTVNQVGILLMR